MLRCLMLLLLASITAVAQTATGRLTYLSDQVVPRGGIFGNFGLRIELLSAFRNVSLRVGGRDGCRSWAMAATVMPAIST